MGDWKGKSTGTRGGTDHITVVGQSPGQNPARPVLTELNCFCLTPWEQEPWTMMEWNSLSDFGEGRGRCRGWHLLLCGGVLSDWWCLWRMSLTEIHHATWPEVFYPLFQSLPGQLAAHGYFLPLAFSPSHRGAVQAPGRDDMVHPKDGIPQMERWRGVRGRVTMVVVLEHLTCGLI